MRMKSLVVAAAFAFSSLFPFISHAADKPLSMHADLHAQLPEKIRSSKTLNLVTDAHYPPCESFAEDNKTMVGFDLIFGMH